MSPFNAMVAEYSTSRASSAALVSQFVGKSDQSLLNSHGFLCLAPFS
jgi:hypothetical protein